MVGSYRTARAVFGALSVLGAVAAFLVPAGGDGLGSGTGSEVGAGGDAGGTLTVRARGDSGQERMQVWVDGAVVGTFTVGRVWGDFQVATPSARLASDVRVAFVNERSTPIDRILWVDSVTFGVVTYQTEDPSVFSDGVSAGGADCEPGHHRFEALGCNGYFGFGDLVGIVEGDREQVAADEGVDGTPITVVAAASAGTEVIELRVGDRVITSFELWASDDLSNNPEFGVYRYRHPGAVDASEVGVAFVDREVGIDGDRNVRLSSISVGTTTAAAAELHLTPVPGSDVDRCQSRWDALRVVSCTAVVTIADSRWGLAPPDPSASAEVSASPLTSFTAGGDALPSG